MQHLALSRYHCFSHRMSAEFNVGRHVMSETSKPGVYRGLIDELVRVCHEGQGQIGAMRARAGVWHPSATSVFIPEQHAINLLLAKLNVSEREVLATMLAHEVEVGVFETLKALETFDIAPFQEGYEGSPCNDFIGRLSDWEWPEK